MPGDFEVEVLDADPRRIKRLRMHRGLARLVGPETPLALPPPVGEARLRTETAA